MTTLRSAHLVLLLVTMAGPAVLVAATAAPKAITPALRDRIHAEFGCAILGLTVDSEDWKRSPPGVVTKHLTIDELLDGSVVLCHEWSDQTAADCHQP